MKPNKQMGGRTEDVAGGQPRKTIVSRTNEEDITNTQGRQGLTHTNFAGWGAAAYVRCRACVLNVQRESCQHFLRYLEYVFVSYSFAKTQEIIK